MLIVGHLLVSTRQHKVKVADMGAIESQDIGKLNGPPFRSLEVMA
jgi:hypothetical protein